MEEGRGDGRDGSGEGRRERGDTKKEIEKRLMKMNSPVFSNEFRV